MSDDQHEHQAEPAVEKQDESQEQSAMLANPADLNSPTIVPQGETKPVSVAYAGFPKKRFHQYLPPAVANDPNELAGLPDELGWRDTPEQADSNRTWTEAEMARMQNMMVKLKGHEEAGHDLIRNSNQADQAMRKGGAEPL